MRNAVLGLTFALGLLAPGACRADVIYQYVTDQPSYAAAVGQTVPVNVLLQETVTGGSTSLMSQTSGLFSYAFYAHQTQGASSGESVIQSYTSAAPFSGAGGSSTPATLPPNSFDFNGNQAIPTSSGPIGALVSANVRQVLLGTLLVKVGTPTTFTLQSALTDPGDAAFAGGDGNTFTLPGTAPYDLDMGGTQTGSAGTVSFKGTDLASLTFTVQPAVAGVPEPSSLAVALVAAWGMGAVGAWRRWRGRAKR
jgi:hypothetical protein